MQPRLGHIDRPGATDERCWMIDLRHVQKAVVSPRVRTLLEQAYQEASTQLEAELEATYQSQAQLEVEEVRTLREQLLRTERVVLQDLQRHGLVDAEVARELAEVVDARLLALQPNSEADAAPVTERRALHSIDLLGRAESDEHGQIQDEQ